MYLYWWCCAIGFLPSAVASTNVCCFLVGCCQPVARSSIYLHYVHVYSIKCSECSQYVCFSVVSCTAAVSRDVQTTKQQFWDARHGYTCTSSFGCCHGNVTCVHDSMKRHTANQPTIRPSVSLSFIHFRTNERTSYATSVPMIQVNVNAKRTKRASGVLKATTTTTSQLGHCRKIIIKVGRKEKLATLHSPCVTLIVINNVSGFGLWCEL